MLPLAPPVREGGRAPGRSRWRLLPALAGAASIAASYLFVSVLAREDRKGHLTLSSFSTLVLRLRGLVRLAAGAVERVLVAPILPSLLGVVALILLRRYQPRTWRHYVALTLILPSLGATASLLLRGDLGLAALAGLLAGICVAGYGGEETGREPSPLLFLVPLGLGAVLRSYTLLPGCRTATLSTPQPSMSISRFLTARRCRPRSKRSGSTVSRDCFAGARP